MNVSGSQNVLKPVFLAAGLGLGPGIRLLPHPGTVQHNHLHQVAASVDDLVAQHQHKNL